MERAVGEQTEIEKLVDEGQQREREMWEGMDPRLKEYVRRKYFGSHMSARIFPSETVAGIPPDLARILDLTEEEILKYSA